MKLLQLAFAVCLIGLTSTIEAKEYHVIVGGKLDPVQIRGGKYGVYENISNYLTKEAPEFVALANKNFMLKKELEVFKKLPGFEVVPFDKMGLYSDEYRT